MDKARRAKAVEEFARLQKEFPEVASAYLAQQLILIEAAEHGNTIVRERMVALLREGVVVPFHEYWEARPLELGGILGCLAKNRNRDPADCFPPLTDWFVDPRKGPPSPPGIGPETRGTPRGG